MLEQSTGSRCRVVAIWIDWYPYHVARFRGLSEAFGGQVAGVELVGGVGVHTGLKFREEIPAELAVKTLMPEASWNEASHLRLAWMLWQHLSKLSPEVVLVPGYYTLPGIVAALWARLHNAQSVLMTESCAFDHVRTPWRERLKSICLRALFDWAITGGRTHLAYLTQLNFPQERVTGFYDVVDNEFFRTGTAVLRKVLTEHGSEQEVPRSPYFLYVGRLAEEKNVATLLASWITYRTAGGTWPLILAGQGPEFQTLQAAAATSQFREDVLFPGLCSSTELLPLYAHAGCFVLPSTREPWGLVVNEAMAAGLPVLVSDRCGCAAELLNEGVTGFSFHPLDQPMLTSLLHRLEALNTEQRKAMGEASAHAISAFSPLNFGRSISSIASSKNSSDSLELLTGDSR